MTSLNIGKTLKVSGRIENQIIHDFNNGGCKTTYGLNTLQRKILINYLFTNKPKCYCVNCLTKVGA